MSTDSMVSPDVACQPSNEACDGRDNDCDGQIDEDFNLQLDVNRCGGCDTICSLTHAQERCIAGECAVGSCEARFVDANSNAADGCECALNLEACDGQDNDCDGETDGKLDVSRDGMAHSSALDDCTRDDTKELVNIATKRTGALTLAVLKIIDTDDFTTLNEGLSPCKPGPREPLSCGWITYKPDCRAAIENKDQAKAAKVCCTQDNDYCGAKYAKIAQEGPVKPYLGCQAAPNKTGSGFLLILLLIGLRRRIDQRQ